MDIQTDNEGNPILDQLSEEGFVDMTFRIMDLIDDGAHYSFHLAASHKNRIVGMDVVLETITFCARAKETHSDAVYVLLDQIHFRIKGALNAFDHYSNQ